MGEGKVFALKSCSLTTTLARHPLGSTSYTYNANGFLPLLVDYSFMLQANWLKFGMLMCFDMGKDNTEPENGKNP